MPLTVQQLIQRQIVQRDLWKRTAGGRGPQPCVAFSRLPGSGAADLGHDVADRLGFGFFGKEILERIARDEGLPRELLETFDEHVRSGIDRFVVDAFRAGTYRESEVLRALVRTVRSIGEAGGAVLVGRGANYILAPERTLRVLVVAPVKARVERFAQSRGLGLEEAEREMAREEEERKRFLSYQFGVEPNDPAYFDLGINTATFTREAACDVVVQAYRARFGPERAGARSQSP
jgi:cytidylate kinase